MKMKLVTRLTEEVEHQLEDVHKMELGSEKYDSAVDGMTKLTGKIVELQKAEAELKKTDYEYREALFNQEMEIKKHETEAKDRLIKNVLTVVSLTVTTGVAIWANVYNWHKEADDTMVNTGGRKAMDFLLGLRKK